MESEKEIITKSEDKDVGEPVTRIKNVGRFDAYVNQIIRNFGRRSRPEIFSIKEGGGGNVEKGQTSATITASYKKGVNNHNQLIQLQGGSQGNRIYSAEGTSVTLASQAGGLGAKTGLYAVLTPDRAKKRQNGRRFKDDGEPSFTLTGQDVHGVYDGCNIRRLTPLECERLQGFEDLWSAKFSDNQRYKMMGNAVSVPVVKEIAIKILKFF